MLVFLETTISSLLFSNGINTCVKKLSIQCAMEKHNLDKINANICMYII
jgi:hypothetical protein